MERSGGKSGMQTGEVVRRTAFNLLDRIHGGRLNRLKEVNKREILEGISQEYEDRRLKAILGFAKNHSEFYRGYAQAQRLEDFPVMNKSHYNQNLERILGAEWREGEIPPYRLSTSGARCAPFTVLCDGDKMDRINMSFISCMELNGFRMGMRRGELRVWIEGK